MKLWKDGIEGFDKNKPVIIVKLTNLGTDSRPIGIIDEMLKERYNIKVSSENYDMIIDSSTFEDPIKGLASIKNDKAIKIFYTTEAALPDLNDYDLTLGFNRIEDPRYLRLPYYRLFWSDQLKASNNQRAKFGECNPNKKYLHVFW